MTRYTVFFDQINRTNLQVKANSPEEARIKASRLYRKRLGIPSVYVEDGWLVESDGEDT